MSPLILYCAVAMVQHPRSSSLATPPLLGGGPALPSARGGQRQKPFGKILLGALEVSRHGERLRELGYESDLAAAADIDRFALVPELRRDPLRIEVGAVGIVKSRWRR